MIKLYIICLNPYSTGSWLLILVKTSMADLGAGSLNPYSTGSWLLILKYNVLRKQIKKVLILILLEVGY